MTDASQPSYGILTMMLLGIMLAAKQGGLPLPFRTAYQQAADEFNKPVPGAQFERLEVRRTTASCVEITYKTWLESGCTSFDRPARTRR